MNDFVPRRTWADKRIAQLRRLVAEGQTDVQIAEVLGTTPAAVKQARYRHGVSRLTQRRDSNVTKAVTQEALVTETSGDLATRLANLQGLSPEAEEESRPPEDSLLQRFLADPTAFFGFLGFSPYTPTRRRA